MQISGGKSAAVHWGDKVEVFTSSGRTNTNTNKNALLIGQSNSHFGLSFWPKCSSFGQSVACHAASCSRASNCAKVAQKMAKKRAHLEVWARVE